MTYREFFIKKRNGKQRRICAPDAELLAAQRAMLPYLEASFYVRLASQSLPLNIFHGFLKNHNCVTAALQHTGYAHTIGLDISNCFDSIYAGSIDTSLDLSVVAHKDGTLAQGFATSPILANTYLIYPVAELRNLLQTMYPTGFALTIYADDVQISVPESDYATLDTVIKFATAIFKKYKLTINPKKTRIHHAKYGNRRILGIQVGSTLQPNRKLKKRIRAARHQRNGPSLGGLITASRMMLPKALR